MDPHVSLWYRWKLVLLFDDNDADALMGISEDHCNDGRWHNPNPMDPSVSLCHKWKVSLFSDDSDAYADDEHG